MDNWTAPAGKWRGIIAMLFVALPISQRVVAQTFEFPVALPLTTLDCIQSRNQTFQIIARTNHGCTSGQPPCHQAEMSITGEIQQSWFQVCGPTNVCGAPFAAGQCCLEPGPSSCLPNTCGHDFKRDYGAVVVPGTYTVTLTFDSLAQGVSPSGQELQPSAEAGWGLDATNSCSRNGAPHVNPVGFGGGMTVHFIVPDFGQTTKLEKVVATDSQTGLVGKALPKPLQARVIRSDGLVKSSVTIDFTLIETPEGPTSVALGSPQTDSAGIASLAFILGASSGTYKIKAFCSVCAAQKEVTFTETALTKQQATVLREVLCRGAGRVGEPLSHPLLVQAFNTITGKGEPGFVTTFTVLAPLSSGTGFDPQSPITEDNPKIAKKGIARTQFKFGNVSGKYSIEVFCPDCQVNPKIACTLEATSPSGVEEGVPKVPQFPKKSVPPGPDTPGLSVTFSPTEIIPSAEASESPVIPGGVNTTQITVQTASNTICSVALTPIPATGGHQHNAFRSVGNLAATATGICTVTGLGMATCQTDALGRAILVYTASQVAGQERVLARIEGIGEATDFLNVRVPEINILSLPSFPPLYTLGGLTIIHPHNHYGKQTLYQEVTRLAEVFRSSFTAVVSVNDMSLANGGLFDIDGNWSSEPRGHKCHRLGTSVDLDRVRVVDRVPIRFCNLADKLEKMVAEKGINCQRVVEQELVKGKFRCRVHLECPVSAEATCPPAPGVASCTELEVGCPD